MPKKKYLKPKPSLTNPALVRGPKPPSGKCTFSPTIRGTLRMLDPESDFWIE